MRYVILKYGVALLAAALLTGCSLLKLSVSTGEPLSKEDVQTRVMTRGFYYDMTAEIVRTADSMLAATPDAEVKMRVIQWKMWAARAAVEAAMQSIPEVALADTWILCRRMNIAFSKGADAKLFGGQTPVARAAAERLEKRAEVLAAEVLTSDRFALMKRFVEQYITENPIAKEEDSSSNTTLEWLRYLKANGVAHAYASGSISEVIADMGDRVGGQTQQLSRSLGWSKELFELQMQQDSTRTRLEGQLDSLQRNFSRMVIVIEHMPQISDHMINTLNKQVQQMIWTMNASVDAAFVNIDRQREQLQVFVSEQRKAMMGEASKAADNAIQTLLDGLPSVIGKVIFWLILLMIVVLGLPFAAGFWLGRLRERVRLRKKEE